MSNSKSNPPDAFIQIARRNEKGKEQYYDVGALWDGKGGYQSGDSLYGRVIIQRREQREEFQRMRNEKQMSINFGPRQNKRNEPEM